MATKFILVGGYPMRATDGGQAFCQEIVKGLGNEVHILDCFFARPRESWENLYEQDQKIFATKLPGHELKFQLAQINIFDEQVCWADVIYLRGGDTEQYLIKVLRQNRGWLKYLGGKVLAGTSAGADAIAKYYYDLDALEIKHGLGLLPIKIIVHYGSDYNAPNIDWDKAFAELRAYREDLPLVTLAEGEFKCFE